MKKTRIKGVAALKPALNGSRVDALLTIDGRDVYYSELLTR
jgi:hypothetical protein